jgi:endoglucanase Acf2
MTIMNTLTQKMTKTLTTIVLTLSTIGMANAASKVVAGDDYVTSKICVAAAGKSKLQLHKVIKESGLSKTYIAEKVTCNNQNIVAFVQEFGDEPEKMNNALTNGKYTTQVNITDLAAN